MGQYLICKSSNPIRYESLNDPEPQELKKCHTGYNQKVTIASGGSYVNY